MKNYTAYIKIDNIAKNRVMEHNRKYFDTLKEARKYVAEKIHDYIIYTLNFIETEDEHTLLMYSENMNNFSRMSKTLNYINTTINREDINYNFCYSIVKEN